MWHCCDDRWSTLTQHCAFPGWAQSPFSLLLAIPDEAYSSPVLALSQHILYSHVSGGFRDAVRTVHLWPSRLMDEHRFSRTEEHFRSVRLHDLHNCLKMWKILLNREPRPRQLQQYYPARRLLDSDSTCAECSRKSSDELLQPQLVIDYGQSFDWDDNLNSWESSTLSSRPRALAHDRKTREG